MNTWRARRAERPRPAPTAATEAFGDELVVYCERTQRMHCLDPHASVIWALCDGEHDTRDIVNETARVLDVDRTRIRADVAAAIEQFRDLGLLR